MGETSSYFHRPGFLFPDNRDGSHHGTNQHENQSHDSRYEIIGTSHLRVVEQFCVHDNRGVLDARLPEFCRGCGDNSVGITTAGDCQIGIGGIGYNLYAFRIESLPLQFPGEGNPQLDLSFAEELVQFLVGMNDVFHGEVLAGIQTIDNMAGCPSLRTT